MFDKYFPYIFNNFFKSKSIQNFFFFALIQSSNVLITIISMPILIQGIGLDQFGLVNLALSVIILLNIFVGFGYNLSAPRQIALYHSEKVSLSHIVSNTFFSKIFLALIASTLILIGVYGLGFFGDYQKILLFSLILLFSEATLPIWFFQGLEKMKLISLSNIFSKLLYLLAIVILIRNPEQSHLVNFFMGFFALCINLLLILYIHVVLGIRIYKPQFSSILISIKDNISLFFSNLASHISINGGLLILSFFSIAETLGMYSLAERVAIVLRIFPSLVIQAIFPKASKLLKQDKKLFFGFLRRSYKITLIVGLLISVFTIIFAPWIIKLLSKSYLEESILYLRLLATLPFLASLNVANTTVLLVLDLKTMLFRASWIMCLYMVFTSVLLTYFFGGVGLAISIISTEIVVFLACSILIFRYNKRLFYDCYF